MSMPIIPTRDEFYQALHAIEREGIPANEQYSMALLNCVWQIEEFQRISMIEIQGAKLPITPSTAGMVFGTLVYGLHLGMRIEAAR